MVKKVNRSKQQRSRETLEERTLRAERSMLERNVRQHRRVRELARTLVKAKALADSALRDVGRMVLDREVPVERDTRAGAAQSE